MIRMLTAIAVASLVATAAVGQAPQPGAAPAPQYQVEVLIFAYREFDPTEERFEPSQAPGDAEAQTLRAPPVFDESNFDPLVLTPSPLDAPAEPDLGFRVLQREELQLTGEYRKIERIPAYLPLLHGGWIQPGLPEEQAQPFDLSMLGVANPIGSVRVHLSRFLHVRIDLQYQDALHTAAGPADPAALSELDIVPRYDLVAERNTRSGELQYFDHPAFGVLLKITPVPTTPQGTPGGRPAA